MEFADALLHRVWGELHLLKIEKRKEVGYKATPKEETNEERKNCVRVS